MFEGPICSSSAFEYKDFVTTHHFSYLIRTLPAMALIVLALVAAGCDENSMPTGINGLPGKDTLGLVIYDTRDTSINITTSSYYRPVTASSSIFLPIGKADGYETRVLMRFLDLPTGFNYGGTIISAKLILHAIPYSIGDKNATLAFNVKEMSRPWSSYSVTADSMSFLNPGSICGSFSGVVADSDEVQIPIDTTVIRKWLGFIANSDAFGINGVLLEPSGAGNVIRTFQSYEFYKPPSIQLIMQNDGDTPDTSTIYPYDDTFIARGPSIPGTAFAVQGGMAYRARLKADLSAVPPGSIINYVSLYLFKDTANCETHFRGIDTVRVYEAYDAVKDTMAGTSYAVLSTIDSTGRIVVQGAALIQAVQGWVNNPSTNYGLILQKYGESSDIDRIVMRGADADASRRPRFVITYTRRQ
jgi:hypothetical protein